jgi:starvation-inducible outer membrane lipoprotein
MKHLTRWTLCTAAVLGLSACSEAPQSLGGNRSDAPAFSGTGKAYAEKSWKQGDKTSWEQQLRARGMNSQNDYSKSN